ncbi:DGQHR domain-containing protein [Lacinutrix gracilariae]|uniref:DGQHR domain-containing protein n=1 Tax=Lacinutrix gracilariae TaxID=1747198 RepID=A0ABW5K3V6_9FLAO
MNEKQKTQILGKLISDNQLNTERRKRKNIYEFETIPVKDDEHRESVKKEYEEKGWVFDRDYSKSIKMKTLKSHDLTFENKVWVMISNLGFDFLNQDRSFVLPYDDDNTQQIDVFAKDNECAIYVECKSSKERKRGNFKQLLESWETKKRGIENSINKLFSPTKLKKKFILATENQTISDVDLERLEALGGIHFDEETIDYYLDMFKELGSAAKYQFLGSLFAGTTIPELKNKIPAITGKMGGHLYYSFSIEPEKLLKIGYVLHRNKANNNMMPTYQRVIKKSRLRSVSEFIENEESPGFFPNSIIINIETKRKLKWEPANTQVEDAISNIGVLYLPKEYKSAYIIDGQHRLYGYASSKYKSTNSIPVVAFVNLSKTEQVDLFMQINENQKAVPKTLRDTLNADLKWSSKNLKEQMQAICSRIAISLGEDKDSPFFNYISIGEDKRILTTTAFGIGIKKTKFLGKVSKTEIEETGIFYKGDLDVAFFLMKRYLKDCFQYLYENLEFDFLKGKDSFLFVNKGITSTIMLLSDILLTIESKQSLLMNKTNLLTIIDSSKHYLDGLIDFVVNIDTPNKEKLMREKGAGAPVIYWRQFQLAVRDKNPHFSPEGLDDYIKRQERQLNNKTYNYIKDIEIFLKEDFKKELIEKLTDEWAWKKGVPEKVQDRAEELMRKKNRERSKEEETTEWDNLNLIHYEQIASQNWSRINPDTGKREKFMEINYTLPGTEKSNKKEQLAWFNKINLIRNIVSHVSGDQITDEQFELVEKIHKWLVKKEIRNSLQENL